ncbi:MAG: leucine-rich repeat protein [Clostridia bacterium]|nr:leucine-rich repeat protein [Clostridia bacterium]
MKKLIFSILIILLCISSLALISCNGEVDTTTADPDLFNITYELNGGTNNENNPVTYRRGDIITLSFPTKEDYMFMGWFTDSTFTNEIKEIKDTENNLTLYAKWAHYTDIFKFYNGDGNYKVSIAPYYNVNTVIIPSHYKGLPVNKISGTSIEHHNMFKTVVIPDTIETIATEAFSCAVDDEVEMSLEYIIVDENNSNFKSSDGVLYSKDGKTLIQYPANKADESFNIPEGVEVISDFAFSRNKDLKSITIPNSVTSIGRCAFIRNSALESVEIPDSVTQIGNSAFRKCIALKNVTLSSNLKIIAREAFSGCTSLECIMIPNGVTTINSFGIYGCTSLKSIVIPESVLTINNSAIGGLSSYTVYCEAESKPDGWDESWSNGAADIIWGYKGEE